MRQALLVSVVLASACAGSSEPEDQITIDQGTYGVLSTSSDIAGQGDTQLAGGSVAAYGSSAPHALVRSATSDGDGVYELALAPGDYVLCTLDARPETLADQWQHNCAGKCTQLAVAAGLARADWASNLSGGWWSAGEHCPR